MGENWEQLVLIFEEYSLIIVGFILIAIIYFSCKWYKQKIKAN